MMDTYNHHKSLQQEFVQQLGYCNKREIPADLACRIAEFCDAHPDDTMTTYYASLLINQFYRRRTKERWRRLIDAMDAHLKNKKFLIEIFLGYALREPQLARRGVFPANLLWPAINSFEDGYGKANLIGAYADLLPGNDAELAYQCALSMPGVFKTRAVGGLYATLDAATKAEIISFLQEEFRAHSAEAAYRLKRVFRYLDEHARNEVINTHLSCADLPESYLAYFVIHNAAFLDNESANRLVVRIRQFKSDYFKNRCLLRLRRYIPEAEIDGLYRRFMDSFVAQEPSSELLHNLYQFSVVQSNVDKDSIVEMALRMIGSFDDSQQDLYEQRKYTEMSFLTPYLSEKHRDQAFAIAATVRGDYRKSLLSRLRRHYSGSKNYCMLRDAPICY